MKNNVTTRNEMLLQMVPETAESEINYGEKRAKPKSRKKST